MSKLVNFKNGEDVIRAVLTTIQLVLDAAASKKHGEESFTNVQEKEEYELKITTLLAGVNHGLELLLCHGLKAPSVFSTSSLFSFIRQKSIQDISESTSSKSPINLHFSQFLQLLDKLGKIKTCPNSLFSSVCALSKLHNIHTPRGKLRSWINYSINTNTLTTFLEFVLSAKVNPQLSAIVETYYEPFALCRKIENLELVLPLVSSLEITVGGGSIWLDVDTEDLDRLPNKILNRQPTNKNTKNSSSVGAGDVVTSSSTAKNENPSTKSSLLSTSLKSSLKNSLKGSLKGSLSMQTMSSVLSSSVNHLWNVTSEAFGVNFSHSTFDTSGSHYDFLKEPLEKVFDRQHQNYDCDNPFTLTSMHELAIPPLLQILIHCFHSEVECKEFTYTLSSFSTGPSVICNYTKTEGLFRIPISQDILDNAVRQLADIGLGGKGKIALTTLETILKPLGPHGLLHLISLWLRLLPTPLLKCSIIHDDDEEDMKESERSEEVIRSSRSAPSNVLLKKESISASSENWGILRETLRKRCLHKNSRTGSFSGSTELDTIMTETNIYDEDCHLVLQLSSIDHIAYALTFNILIRIFHHLSSERDNASANGTTPELIARAMGPAMVRYEFLKTAKPSAKQRRFVEEALSGIISSGFPGMCRVKVRMERQKAITELKTIINTLRGVRAEPSLYFKAAVTNKNAQNKNGQNTKQNTPDGEANNQDEDNCTHNVGTDQIEDKGIDIDDDANDVCVDLCTRAFFGELEEDEDSDHHFVDKLVKAGVWNLVIDKGVSASCSHLFKIMSMTLCIETNGNLCLERVRAAILEKRFSEFAERVEIDYNKTKCIRQQQNGEKNESDSNGGEVFPSSNSSTDERVNTQSLLFLENLKCHFPQHLRDLRMEEVFSSTIDRPKSLSDLFMACSNFTTVNNHSLLVITDSEQQTFGCFVTHRWYNNEQGGYYGADGQSNGINVDGQEENSSEGSKGSDVFLFKYQANDVEVFRSQEDLMQMSDLDSLAIGSSPFAIFLDEDLTSGTSAACPSFSDSPQLSTDDFDVQSLKLFMFPNSS
eukprot:g2202.t1